MSFYSYRNDIRNKIEELIEMNTAEIAEAMVDLEDEKAELEKEVAALTEERDELVSQLADEAPARSGDK